MEESKINKDLILREKLAKRITNSRKLVGGSVE
jgi:hypothetical protein